MYIQSRIFKFIFKLESSTDFCWFFREQKNYPEMRALNDKSLSIKSFSERCLKVLQISRVHLFRLLSKELICICWLECFLKSFPSHLKLVKTMVVVDKKNSLVQLIHDVIYIFKVQLLMNIVSFSHFNVFSKRQKFLILVRNKLVFQEEIIGFDIVFELVLHCLML